MPDKRMRKNNKIHIGTKRVFYLFLLDALFLLAAFLFSLEVTSYSRTFSIVFLILEILTLSITAFYTLLPPASFHMEDAEMYINSSFITSDRLFQVEKLVTENLLQFQYQPILQADTGEIIAYEFLMATPPDMLDLQPKEILELAAAGNYQYYIEKFTLFRAMELIQAKPTSFLNKKLFVKCIPGHLLTDEDFTELLHTYGPLLHHLVIEISETELLLEDQIALIIQRIREAGCQLALADYGSGVSNVSNLVNLNPGYIKIGPSILRSIQTDGYKQHFLSGLVTFALHNNIKLIAEEIESREEFRCILPLGIEFMQGAYLSGPTPFPMQQVPEEISMQIQEIMGRKSEPEEFSTWYETKGEVQLYPVTLASEMYTDLMIYEKELQLYGNEGMVANLSLHIPDKNFCTLTLDHVNLKGKDKPTIVIGKNCSVTLHLIGENYIAYDGIRVPETSTLKIIGEGSLTIQTERSNRIGIGGNANQSYGNLTFAGTGTIKIVSSGSVTVGIGGGHNPTNSVIRFLSGNISIETTGYSTLGIGCISGNSFIHTTGGSLNLICAGTKSVGIGSLSGYVDIVSSAHITIKCDGKNAIAIGSLDDSDGNILIQGGQYLIRLSSQNGAGIGSLSGAVSILITNGDISIYGEGSDVFGIGNHTGFGDVCIKNGIVSIQLYAANATPMGNLKRQVIIDGGNIQFDFPEDITPVNSFGTPLVARIIMDSDEFCQTVDTVSYSYEYRANYSDNFPYIKVYLPEGIHY